MPVDDPRKGANPIQLIQTPRGRPSDPSDAFFSASDRILPFAERFPKDYPTHPPELLKMEYQFFYPFAKAVADHAGIDVLDDRMFKRLRQETKYKRLFMVMTLEGLKIQQGCFVWDGFKVLVEDFPVVRATFEAWPDRGQCAIRSLQLYEKANGMHKQVVRPGSPLGINRELALRVIFTYFEREGVLAPRKDMEEEP